MFYLFLKIYSNLFRFGCIICYTYDGMIFVILIFNHNKKKVSENMLWREPYFTKCVGLKRAMVLNFDICTCALQTYGQKLPRRKEYIDVLLVSEHRWSLCLLLVCDFWLWFLYIACYEGFIVGRLLFDDKIIIGYLGCLYWIINAIFNLEISFLLWFICEFL